MRNYFRVEKEKGPLNRENIKLALNIVTTAIGLLLMLLGLYLSLKIFFQILYSLNNPGFLEKLLYQWARTMKWDALEFTFENKTYSFAYTLSLIVLAVGGFILVALALSMVRTGAEIISYTYDERKTVKSLLQRFLDDLSDVIAKREPRPRRNDKIPPDDEGMA